MAIQASTRADQDKPKLIGEAAKRPEVNSPSPATRRLPRQGITTWLQCTPADSDVRRDVPAAKHCNSFLLPLVPLPLRL
jgi:hypothetical protein